MGLVHGIFDKAVSNASMCRTWQDIEASHMTSGQVVVLKLDDLYGILCLLAIGLSGSLMIMFAEAFILWAKVKINTRAML